MIHFTGPLNCRHRITILGMNLILFPGLLSCRGPEIRIDAREHLIEPFTLMVRLPDGPDQPAREKLLRDNLNAVLGTTHALILAEDRKERDPILWIEVQESTRGDVSKQAVTERVNQGAVEGTTAGFATGAEAVSASGNGASGKQAASDNLAFVVVTTAAGAAIGTVAGTVGGVSEGVVRGAYHDARLGYRPKHLMCTVSYAPDGTTAPHRLGTTDAWAVLKEMHPMNSGDAHNVQKLHEEEARALSVVVDRILKRAGAL